MIKLHQVINGEIKGLGTGTLVWPAAHVMTKYIEKLYRHNDGDNFVKSSLLGKNICDIGSGTGCTGLVAAALGAKVTLTDQECVLFLLEQNKDLFAQSHPSFVGNVTIQKYDWGSNSCDLNTPFDYIFISDCVLPKLYPIDILIEV